MKCCVHCFKDPLLQKTITEFGIIGDCDFCSSKNVPVYDISNQNELSDKIIDLIQIYEASFHEDAKPLKKSLHDDWNIFSGGTEAIQTLLLALCAPYSAIDPNSDIFSVNVIIPQAYDEEYINDYGVIKGQAWHQFSESIKHENRFHNSYFNGDALSSFLSAAVKSVKLGDIFYRARIASNNFGFKRNEMYAPPAGFRKQGRINPDGIGVLYLASDIKTALHEVRASKYDYVTIGTFRPQKTLRIVDLSAISRLSPFHSSELASVFINREVFKEMALEIAKPQRRSDSALEYLSTQYISEFVKAQGYDGVAYDSTLSKDGYNLAIYDQTNFKCTSVKTIEVTEIDYKYKNSKKAED